MERVQFKSIRNAIKARERYKKRMLILLVVLAIVCLVFKIEHGKQAKIINLQKENIEQLEEKLKNKEWEISTFKKENTALKTQLIREIKNKPKEFTFYNLPSEYIQTGGDLPEDVQKTIFSLCKEYGIDYAVVLAMIETESGYKKESVSEAGALGYMQIIPKYHEERIKKFNGSKENITDPILNVSIGIDYIAYLNNKYKNMHKALTAYCYGENGAKEHIWDKGYISSDYSQKVLLRATRIENELRAGKETK